MIYRFGPGYLCSNWRGGRGGPGGGNQSGLMTWAAGRRRWPAGVGGGGSEMAGGGGRADGREDDVGVS